MSAPPTGCRPAPQLLLRCLQARDGPLLRAAPTSPAIVLLPPCRRLAASSTSVPDPFCTPMSRHARRHLVLPSELISPYRATFPDACLIAALTTATLQSPISKWLSLATRIAALSRYRIVESPATGLACATGRRTPFPPFHACHESECPWCLAGEKPLGSKAKSSLEPSLAHSV